jgi:hypothetical protein
MQTVLVHIDLRICMAWLQCTQTSLSKMSRWVHASAGPAELSTLVYPNDGSHYTAAQGPKVMVTSTVMHPKDGS